MSNFMKSSYSNFGSGRVEERVPLHLVVPLSVPFAIGINVSDYCNFKCAYCWHSLTTPPQRIPRNV